MCGRLCRWWLDRLRRAFSLYDRVRLDHFLGFHSYFSIPAGKACADGRWLAGPGKDLFQTAYDELGPLNFIAEDLGYLTPGVRAMANLEKSQFYSCYRNFFDSTPHADLNLLRLEKAKNLLTNEALPVQQVALLCGFSNLSHFSRYFRKNCGCSPSEWARRP